MEQNTGSFGAAIGGMTPALQAAVSRRSNTAVPATAQVSNSAPTANPSTQIPASGGPVGAPAMTPTGVPTPQSANPSLPFDSGEAKMIIGALSSRLKSLSSLIPK